MKSKYEIIPLDRIHDPEAPLRSDLSPESVQDLTESIKQVGIIEPLIVRKKDGAFEIVAGHRRLVAAEIAGLTEAPCLVMEIDEMGGEILKLHENLARADINPIDWANHLAYLKSYYNLSNAKVAEMVGMSETWVFQHLEILKYPEALLEMMKADRVTFSVARELVQIKDEVKRGIYIRAAITGGCTPALAVKWRKECNREPLQPNEEPTASVAAADGGSSGGSLPICRVCGQEIPFEEQMTITIHANCQPQPVGAADGP